MDKVKMRPDNLKALSYTLRKHRELAKSCPEEGWAWTEMYRRTSLNILEEVDRIWVHTKLVEGWVGE